MILEPPTTEQIARHYNSALDSVNLINALVSQGSLTEEEELCLERNAEHLEIMLAKDFWTTEDLTPFQAAVAAATSVG
jgi:hypothetical protein